MGKLVSSPEFPITFDDNLKATWFFFFYCRL